MVQKSETWVCYDDLNDFVDSFRQDNDLIEISDEVSPRLEIGAILEALGEKEGPAVLFKKVAGFPEKVIVGNVMGHRRRLAKALGVLEAELTKDRKLCSYYLIRVESFLVL